MTLGSEVSQFLASFLSGAFGAGCIYGVMKTRLNGVEKRVDKNETRLETRGVMWADLEHRCDKCHDVFIAALNDMKVDLKEVKQNVEETRDKLPTRVAELLRNTMR